MTRPLNVITCGITVLFLTACPSSGTRVPVTTPSYPAAVTDTSLATSSQRFRFVPGHFRYRLTQNTRIEDDTSESAVLTTAHLSAEIAPNEKAGYEILISVDSFHIVTESPIPAHPITQSQSLGPVLHASTSNTEIQLDNRLPDSLCAYSQFVVAARELLLPELPHEIGSPIAPVRPDSTRITACRAGTRIEMLITRQLRELQRQPLQLAVQGRTELSGNGVLGRDSVTVTGSTTTDGTVSFAGPSRLPSLVTMKSDASITVRLGKSTADFRQHSTLEIREEQIQAPP